MSDQEPRYRIAWRSLVTGKSGRSQATYTEQAARSWIKLYARPGTQVEHRMERARGNA